MHNEQLCTHLNLYRHSHYTDNKTQQKKRRGGKIGVLPMMIPKYILGSCLPVLRDIKGDHRAMFLWVRDDDNKDPRAMYTCGEGYQRRF